MKWQWTHVDVINARVDDPLMYSKVNEQRREQGAGSREEVETRERRKGEREERAGERTGEEEGKG